MALKNLFALAIVFFLTFSYLNSARAQDTFGPICDDVTVTCIPTETPTVGPSVTPGSETPTPTETPTETPSPTIPPPTELPRAGVSDNLNLIVVIGLSFVIAGLFTHLVLLPANK